MKHEMYLNEVIKIAKKSLENGNLPYGCLLVDEEGNILLEGENSVLTAPDLIGHAEINLIQQASKKYSVDVLKKCTIYTSDEPCSMCSSAIYWAGIKRLVFGLSKKRFYQEFGRENPDWDFEISASEVLSHGGRKTEVLGPYCEDKVIELHRSSFSE